MNLNELLQQCLFCNGVFYRIDIPIRYMAVKLWAEEKIIHPLWWRMQYVKLWYWWGAEKIAWGDEKDSSERKNNDIEQQKNRLIESVELFKKGIVSQEPIVFFNDMSLKDGSHRLSGQMFFNVSKVNYVVAPEYGSHYEKRIDQFIVQLYTKEEYAEIEKMKNKIISDLEAGRWTM